MKTVIFITLLGIIQSCEKNCFLGGAFFSSPLDEQGCCLDVANDKCSQYVQVNRGYFVCDRCQAGYVWSNNKCKRIKSSKICMNPEMITIPFYPCQMCRFEESDQYVPIFDASSKKKYNCVELEKAQIDKFVRRRLKNCLVTGADHDSIFCYECREGFIQDWKTQ